MLIGVSVGFRLLSSPAPVTIIGSLRTHDSAAVCLGICRTRLAKSAVFGQRGSQSFASLTQYYIYLASSQEWIFSLFPLMLRLSVGTLALHNS